MSKQTDFINIIAPLARAEYTNRTKWVLPSVCIAQAALESGWNTKAQTLFGIKGNGSSLQTVEYINGKYQTVTAAFKSYPSVAAAVHGYYDLICNNKRYSGAVNNPDYVSAIQAIKAGGYATDPNYVNKIISIIKSNNLTQYDKKLRSTSPEPKKAPAPLFSYGRDYRVTASALRVRFQPSLGSKIKKMYPRGTVFTCLQTYNSSDGTVWVRTPSGWVCGYDGRTRSSYAVAK